MKFNTGDRVVLKDKKAKNLLWTYCGETNWRPNHHLLSNCQDDLLHPYHENEFRLATLLEIKAGYRLEQIS